MPQSPRVAFAPVMPSVSNVSSGLQPAGSFGCLLLIVFYQLSFLPVPDWSHYLFVATLHVLSLPFAWQLAAVINSLPTLPQHCLRGRTAFLSLSLLLFCGLLSPVCSVFHALSPNCFVVHLSIFLFLCLTDRSSSMASVRSFVLLSSD